MRYLTVHDIVWINTTVTGSVNRYDYVTLEEAMAGQYRYGNSENVPEQAAAMLERLVLKPPFEAGNRRSAMIALLTFLNANGRATCCSDAELAGHILAIERRDRKAGEVVTSLAAPAANPVPETVTLRKLITHECNAHAEALKILGEDD